MGRHWIHQSTLASTWGCFKNTYELITLLRSEDLRAPKLHIFQCMVYGQVILCVISKSTFEIPHKISYPYNERYKFYTMLKIEELSDLRAQMYFWNDMPSSLLLWIKWHSKVILESFSYIVYQWLSLRLWLLHCKHMKLPQSCAGPLILSYITTLFYHVNFKWGEKMIIYSIFSPQWNSYNDKTTFLLWF